MNPLTIIKELHHAIGVISIVYILGVSQSLLLDYMIPRLLKFIK